MLLCAVCGRCFFFLFVRDCWGEGKRMVVLFVEFGGLCVLIERGRGIIFFVGRGGGVVPFEVLSV